MPQSVVLQNTVAILHATGNRCGPQPIVGGIESHLLDGQIVHRPALEGRPIGKSRGGRRPRVGGTGGGARIVVVVLVASLHSLGEGEQRRLGIRPMGAGHGAAIGGQGHNEHDGEDRQHDHQLDQGETSPPVASPAGHQRSLTQ